MIRPTVLGGLLLLAACGGNDQLAADNEAKANAAEPADRPSTQAAASAAALRCAPGLKPWLDEESIVGALEGQTGSTDRLDAFKNKASAVFDTAAESLCKAGKLDPKLLQPFRTLLVLNGSGATEATFFEDPHEYSGEDLIFQWTFVESGLQVPPQQDVEAGLLCWANPNGPGCADRGP